MNKKKRQLVYEKFGGRCAYCGKELAYKDMQVDHKDPLFRNDTDEQLAKAGIKRGTDDMENLMPSCRRCNFRKGTLTLDQFRRELYYQCKRVLERNFQVKQSIDYGLLHSTLHPVIFYFEYYSYPLEHLNELMKEVTNGLQKN